MGIPKLTDLLNDNSGNFAILTALASVPMMIGVGVAVEMSNLQRVKSELRDAAETAAIASVRSDNVTDATRKLQARTHLDKNFDRAVYKARKVKMNLDLTPIRSTVEAKTIIPTQLMGMIGQKTLSVRAKVAAEVVFEPACVLINAPNKGPSLKFQGHPSMNTENCYVHNNSDAPGSSLAQGNPVLGEADFCLNGGYTGKKWIPGPQQGCGSKDDPYMGLLEPPIPDCGDGFKKGKPDETITLEPGNFCGGLKIPANTNVELEPGIYIISDGGLSMGANASISGDGVMFYLAGEKSHFDLHSGGNWDISPPTDGAYRGIAIFQERGMTPDKENQITAGGTLDMRGAIYTKNADLKLHGSPTVNLTGGGTMIVTNSLTLQGSPQLNVIHSSDPSLLPNDVLIGRYAEIRVIL